MVSVIYRPKKRVLIFTPYTPELSDYVTAQLKRDYRADIGVIASIADLENARACFSPRYNFFDTLFAQVPREYDLGLELVTRKASCQETPSVHIFLMFDQSFNGGDHSQLIDNYRADDKVDIDPLNSLNPILTPAKHGRLELYFKGSYS